MVHAGIKAAYDRDLAEVARIAGVAIAARSQAAGAHPDTEARAALLLTDARTYLANPRLSAEIYGPAIGRRALCLAAGDAPARARPPRAPDGDHPRHRARTSRSSRSSSRSCGERRAGSSSTAFRRASRSATRCTTAAPTRRRRTRGRPRSARPRSTASRGRSATRTSRSRRFPRSSRNANPRGIWRLVDGELTKDAAVSPASGVDRGRRLAHRRASRRAWSSAGWPELDGADDGGPPRGARIVASSRSGAASCSSLAATTRSSGALLTPPVSHGAVAGVVFFDNVGPLWMCGHGTIGVVRTLEHLGRIAPGRDAARHARRDRSAAELAVGRSRDDRERAGPLPRPGRRRGRSRRRARRRRRRLRRQLVLPRAGRRGAGRRATTSSGCAP